MPQNIEPKHVSRMFPFEFYDELSENLNDYVLANPAFMLRDQLNMDTAKRKQLYESSQSNDAVATLRQNNIIDVEPFGEMLTLDICYSKKHVQILLNEPDKRSQLPLSILVAQLYDSSNQPVFAHDVSDDTIARIPEVLWDDPNLLLAIIIFGESETQVGVLKIPERIEEKLFETVQDAPSSTPNENN